MKQILNFWGRHGDPGDPSNALPGIVRCSKRGIFVFIPKLLSFNQEKCLLLWSSSSCSKWWSQSTEPYLCSSLWHNCNIVSKISIRCKKRVSPSTQPSNHHTTIWWCFYFRWSFFIPYIFIGWFCYLISSLSASFKKLGLNQSSI